MVTIFWELKDEIYIGCLLPWFYFIDAEQLNVGGSLLCGLYLGSHGLEPHPGRGVVLEHVPHVGLAQDEEVAVAHRPDTGRPPVACGAHVEDADLPEVGPGLEGGQHSLPLVVDHLEPSTGAYVHLLAHLA